MGGDQADETVSEFASSWPMRNILTSGDKIQARFCTIRADNGCLSQLLCQDSVDRHHFILLLYFGATVNGVRKHFLAINIHLSLFHLESFCSKACWRLDFLRRPESSSRILLRRSRPIDMFSSTAAQRTLITSLRSFILCSRCRLKQRNLRARISFSSVLSNRRRHRLFSHALGVCFHI